MKIKLYICCCITLSTSVLAQEVPPAQNVFFQNISQVQPELLLSQPNINTSTPAPIRENSSLEERINFAIISKEWLELERLLSQYRTATNFDPTLYDYGLGALYRYQGRQKEAIALYRQILVRQPDLHYPRFDLAMMLYEDKRYAEAKIELETAAPYVAQPLQSLIGQVLTSIQKSQEWQPSFNFSYESTDNVNQASDIKELVVGEATFVRSDDSLPQDAHGIRYNIGSAKEKNITGNSYAYTGIDIAGVNYWDNSDYSELTLQANLGYRHKNINQSWGAVAGAGQNLLGGSRYNQNYGLALEYNRKISDQWQVSGSVSHLQKNYNEKDLADFYDGYANSNAWVLLYQPKPRWLVYAGTDFTNDNLADKAESSDRKSVRGGMVFSGNDVNARSSIRYSKRDFKGDNFFYGERRKDDEYQFGATIGHKKLSWQGLIPKLNYEYQKIDSNLPLYERSNSTVFIKVDKKF